MPQFIKNFWEHPKSTIEGTVWGVGVVAAGTYMFSTFHCTVPSDFSFLPWLMGGVAFVRGAIAGGVKAQSVEYGVGAKA